MAHAVRRRDISSTKVKALPEWLGQCTLLEILCVPPAAGLAAVRGGAARSVADLFCRRLRGAAAAAGPTGFTRERGVADRGYARARRGRPGLRASAAGPRPLGAAARLARRYAHYSELAALPAAVEWPNLKSL